MGIAEDEEEDAVFLSRRSGAFGPFVPIANLVTMWWWQWWDRWKINRLHWDRIQQSNLSSLVLQSSVRIYPKGKGTHHISCGRIGGFFWRISCDLSCYRWYEFFHLFHKRSKQAKEPFQWKERVGWSLLFVSPFQFSASIIQDCLKAAAKTDCSGLL